MVLPQKNTGGLVSMLGVLFLCLLISSVLHRLITPGKTCTIISGQVNEISGLLVILVMSLMLNFSHRAHLIDAHGFKRLVFPGSLVKRFDEVCPYHGHECGHSHLGEFFQKHRHYENFCDPEKWKPETYSKNNSLHRVVYTIKPFFGLIYRNFSKSLFKRDVLWLKSMAYAVLADLITRVAVNSVEAQNFLSAMSVVANSLQFLTVMLLSTYIAHELGRWGQQEDALLSTQGRLNGIAMFLSAAMRNDGQKRLAYRFYR
jgi:hypothetical protein